MVASTFYHFYIFRYHTSVGILPFLYLLLSYVSRKTRTLNGFDFLLFLNKMKKNMHNSKPGSCILILFHFLPPSIKISFT